MLNPNIKKRFGATLRRMYSRTTHRGEKSEEEILDKVLLQNLEIRNHPFMSCFAWEKCERRLLVVRPLSSLPLLSI